MQYLYTGETDISPENVVELLTAANLFTMQDLQEECELVISRDIETDSAAYILEMADRYLLATCG